jgi:hypothetical protein
LNSENQRKSTLQSTLINLLSRKDHARQRTREGKNEENSKTSRKRDSSICISVSVFNLAAIDCASPRRAFETYQRSAIARANLRPLRDGADRINDEQ